MFSIANRMIPALTGSEVVELLNVKFPTVERRVPDVVARLSDGRILHLELQSENDPEMPWRMLQYYLLLRSRYPREVIHQAVLYVGFAKLTMADFIHTGQLKYRYELRDVRGLNAEQFLGSHVAAERLVALLCDPLNPRLTMRQILDSWLSLPEDEQASLYSSLVIISGLRKLEDTVEGETRERPLPETLITENKLLGKWMDQGRATMLKSQIGYRFGELPGWAEARIDQADHTSLNHWAIRVLDASTIENVFTSVS